MKNTDIAAHLKLPPVKLHCSMLAEDAIKAAIMDYRMKNIPIESEESNKSKESKEQNKSKIFDEFDESDELEERKSSNQSKESNESGEVVSPTQ